MKKGSNAVFATSQGTRVRVSQAISSAARMPACQNAIRRRRLRAARRVCAR